MKLPDFGEPKSLNQRVVGSSPTAPTKDTKSVTIAQIFPCHL